MNIDNDSVDSLFIQKGAVTMSERYGRFMAWGLRVEELALFFAGLWVWHVLAQDWGLFLLWFLAPDLSMLGFVLSQRIGTVAYNVVHHRGLALLVAGYGAVTATEWMLLTGIILFTHIALDRVFGFGLKYFSGFRHTHLNHAGGI